MNTIACTELIIDPLEASFGAEVHRYFSVKHCGLISVRENGVTLLRRLGTGWKVLLRKKPDVPLELWQAGKNELFEGLPAWQRDTRDLPSLEMLQEWEADGVCETPTGERVEPDGTGSDGVPSWLRLLGFV